MKKYRLISLGIIIWYILRLYLGLPRSYKKFMNLNQIESYTRFCGQVEFFRWTSPFLDGYSSNSL